LYESNTFFQTENRKPRFTIKKKKANRETEKKNGRTSARTTPRARCAYRSQKLLPGTYSTYSRETRASCLARRIPRAAAPHSAHRNRAPSLCAFAARAAAQ
jgi:hypothetical protein